MRIRWGKGEEVGTILNQGENINQEKHLKLETNQAPPQAMGINCAFTIRWLSASLRPKERGIKPAKIKK
jgi:hypothetical protein